MSEVLIRGYKAKEQIEEIIEAAKYGSNNCMIGEGLEIIEIQPHGDLIDRFKLLHPEGNPFNGPMAVTACTIIEQPTVIPANKEAPA